ncbi:MAG: ThiF family adenylyltransferase [Candidatus Eisenbacteria bacterium]|nr:ThiF family adenylyltransferase [Candidatus Eisenbacteria bacterium]
MRETFTRVTGAYDLLTLAYSRVIAVGLGGGAGMVEDLARTGVGHFVLIDPDRIEESNLATQQTYRRDVGRPKVEALAGRLRDLNPAAEVLRYPCRLDEIDDREFERFAFKQSSAHWPYTRPLILGMTDSFAAQARVNRLSLQFDIASLCAQVYAEGRGAEVTFTCPGTTPACHRCILQSRYEAYLVRGFKNDVTSDGAPIFATTALNALKGFIALALLHHHSHHPRWGGLVARIGNRNLIQLRLDPDLTLGVFQRVLAGDPQRVLFFDSVWLPQDPVPGCPDCGGTGDLRQARGRLDDTRQMLPAAEGPEVA